VRLHVSLLSNVTPALCRGLPFNNSIKPVLHGRSRHKAGRTVGVVASALLLASCSGKATSDASTNTTSLDAAAIAAGVIADPANTDPTGLFARDRDKICVVPSATAFRIGIYVDYGETFYCSGSGEATRAGEALHVELTSAPGCSFDAQFEGDRIAIPGKLPDACQKACSERASLAGLSVERLSDSPSEAGAMRDGKGKMLCSGANSGTK